MSFVIVQLNDKRDVYFVYVNVSYVLCFLVHSTTTSGVHSHFEVSDTLAKSQQLDTNFDIQYVCCSTDHYVYCMINVLSMELKSM